MIVASNCKYVKLKPYTGNIISPPNPVPLDGELEYDLESILAHWHVGYHKHWKIWSHFLDMAVVSMNAYLHKTIKILRRCFKHLRLNYDAEES